MSKAKTALVPPYKVRVLNGDGTKELGIGEYVADVDVHAFVKTSGKEPQIKSLHDAECMPSDVQIKIMQRAGWTFQKIMNNPKIVMPDGTIHYGCQVWWEPIV